MDRKQQAEYVSDIEDALRLIRSQDWKVYVNFLKRRAVKLQDSVNAAVEKGDIVAAQIALAILKDNRKQAELFAKENVHAKAELNKKGDSE